MFRWRIDSRLEHTLLACEASSGELLGFAVALPAKKELEQLFLSARARGKGVAARLLDAAEEYLGRRSSLAGPAFLTCFEGNARARAFYEKRGWTNRGMCSHDAEVSGGSHTRQLLKYEK